MSLPVVKRDEKGIPTLYVHDKPFFMKSGEIHNSSASDPVFLEEKLWPALQGLNMNSVTGSSSSPKRASTTSPCWSRSCPPPGARG